MDVGNSGVDSIRDFIELVKGYQSILGPNGGMGDWRYELRLWIIEASHQVRRNFDTHSAAGKPFDDVEEASARHRTNISKRNSLKAMTDEGKITSASSVQSRGVHSSDIKGPRGFRGLREAASNIERGKEAISNYKMAKQSVIMGAKGGDSGIPYASSHLQPYGGRPARNYLALPQRTMNILMKELVEDGVRARLEGFTNSNRTQRR